MENIQKLPDEKIVKLVREGNKEIYAEIIRRYQQKLLRYALSLIRDDAAGADAVQEGLIKAYINLNSFNTNKKFSSWLYRIVHNEVMNIYNKSKNTQVFFENADFDSGANLEDDLVKKELIATTNNCISSMPVIYSEPLVLFYLDDKSYEEISDILRLPMGTVATRINRAKGMMRKICQRKKI